MPGLQRLLDTLAQTDNTMYLHKKTQNKFFVLQSEKHQKKTNKVHLWRISNTKFSVISLAASQLCLFPLFSLDSSCHHSMPRLAEMYSHISPTILLNRFETSMLEEWGHWRDEDMDFLKLWLFKTTCPQELTFNFSVVGIS